MKQIWTMHIYKTDRRYKSGERAISTQVWLNRDEAEMRREVSELQRELYPVSKGYRVEFHARMTAVKSPITDNATSESF